LERGGGVTDRGLGLSQDSWSKKESDGIEEGDQIEDPKAPSKPQTPIASPVPVPAITPIEIPEARAKCYNFPFSDASAGHYGQSRLIF
jgi:hypothetical protein